MSEVGFLSGLSVFRLSLSNGEFVLQALSVYQQKAHKRLLSSLRCWKYFLLLTSEQAISIFPLSAFCLEDSENARRTAEQNEVCHFFSQQV